MNYSFHESTFINREKYASLTGTDETAPIYICDWYLDAAADNWGVLTDTDYTTVLPLAFRKKFGIRYFYQPFFTRNTLIVGKSIDADAYIKILSETAPDFRYWDFSIEASAVSGSTLKTEKRVYQQLVLDDYENIYKGYAGNLKRSISSALNAGIRITEAVSVEQFVADYRRYTAHRIPEFNDAAYRRLQTILFACIKNATVYFLSARKDEKELAAAFFARTGKKIIYIEGFSSPEGRKLQAMHLLFDHLIKQTCNQDLRLDFGGSNVKSIAHFFHAFGGKDVPYFNIRKDNLPGVVKLIRRLKR